MQGMTSIDVKDWLFGWFEREKHRVWYQRGVKRGKVMARERFVHILRTKDVFGPMGRTSADKFFVVKQPSRGDYINGYNTGFEDAARLIEMLP